MKKEIRQWLEENPTDRIRLRASMRAHQVIHHFEEKGPVYTRVLEDDPEKFFRRSLWLISDGDLWRWRLACDVERELDEGW